jgi:hypothetical protein
MDNSTIAVGDRVTFTWVKRTITARRETVSIQTKSGKVLRLMGKNAVVKSGRNEYAIPLGSLRKSGERSELTEAFLGGIGHQSGEASTYLIIVLFIALLAVLVIHQNRVPVRIAHKATWERVEGGVTVIRDPDEGCLYIYYGHGLTPRLNQLGQPICRGTLQ